MVSMVSFSDELRPPTRNLGFVKGIRFQNARHLGGFGITKL